jgi:hypothetical protein
MSSEWKPLKLLLGPKFWASFMYMGRSGGIFLYKHRDTRRYLNIDSAGACFRYLPGGYQPIGLNEAMADVFELTRIG